MNNVLIRINSVNIEGLDSVNCIYSLATSIKDITKDLQELQEGTKSFNEGLEPDVIYTYPVITEEAVAGLMAGVNPEYKELILNEVSGDCGYSYVATCNKCVSMLEVLELLVEYRGQAGALTFYKEFKGDINAVFIPEGVELPTAHSEEIESYNIPADFIPYKSNVIELLESKSDLPFELI